MTITLEVHRDTVEQFIMMLDVSEGDIVFQQDNARRHVAKETMEILQEFFGERIVKWPPCSPDLSLLDYFLWGYFKNTVYKSEPTTLEQLKNKIEEEMKKNFAGNIKACF